MLLEGVSVSAEHLEESFSMLLAAQELTLEFLEKLPEIVARQWEERGKRIKYDQMG